MELLPKIKEAAYPRPSSGEGKSKHLVPNPEYKDFWRHFYGYIMERYRFNLPVEDALLKVNPFFGYFGRRFHIDTLKPRYFQIGVDIADKPKTPIYPIRKGVLQYSGFGYVNGYYVMISHPDIRTEDGFVLYSLYMHMKETKVGFTSYQKMLREISLHTYPEIWVPEDKVIGHLGDTGISHEMYTHLHMQLEFRNSKGVMIAVDPLSFYGVTVSDNLTAEIKNHNELEGLFFEHKDLADRFGVTKYWERRKKEL